MHNNHQKIGKTQATTQSVKGQWHNKQTNSKVKVLRQPKPLAPSSKASNNARNQIALHVPQSTRSSSSSSSSNASPAAMPQETAGAQQRATPPNQTK